MLQFCIDGFIKSFVLFSYVSEESYALCLGMFDIKGYYHSSGPFNWIQLHKEQLQTNSSLLFNVPVSMVSYGRIQ